MEATGLQIQSVSVDGGAERMSGVCVAVSTLWQGKHTTKRTGLTGKYGTFEVQRG